MEKQNTPLIIKYPFWLVSRKAPNHFRKIKKNIVLKLSACIHYLHYRFQCFFIGR